MKAPREARLAAQAKLNLFLRVLAREAGGYHQLETLFCRIMLADSVTVRRTDGPRSLDVTGDGVDAGAAGPMERNLGWLAATEYAARTGFPAGFEIGIVKRIPVGAGLGGGSADAGGVLRALNALNPNPLDPGRLLRLAAGLGADVPFLTQDRATLALGWGRGDQMLLLPTLPASAVWLVVPSVGVKTGDAYRWLDEGPPTVHSRTVSVSGLSTWAGVAGLCGNDFEAPVAAHVPIVQRLLGGLRNEVMREILGDSSMVFMTGSGSAIAVVSGTRPERELGPPPPVEGSTIIETETATFVEPVVLTH